VRSFRWSWLVPAIAALAGLLFTTSARTAAGTNLRDDRRPELTRLIAERRVNLDRDEATAARLRAQIDAFRAFFHAMLARGVYLPPSAFEAWFVSGAHDDDALAIVADALPHAARAASRKAAT